METSNAVAAALRTFYVFLCTGYGDRSKTDPSAPGNVSRDWSDYEAESYRLEAHGLEDVFEILNIAHPADYRRRSLSVGDVVVDLDAGTAHLVRGVGWEDISGRLWGRWLAHRAKGNARRRSMEEAEARTESEIIGKLEADRAARVAAENAMEIEAEARFAGAGEDFNF